ncbi:NAD(P)-binding protein [Polychaeton citri CBS 116435]|uniref:Arsenite methyltransferase n=1 Tax=Polychaeton citri CBS 116435 TaxID=1314669 RepID=A0A9P4QCM4_9PEZI|nr:NAD(P)-binding protein [Polychaeton citri CBS 116435]
MITTITSSGKGLDTYTLVEDSYAYRADNTIDRGLRERIAVALGYNEEDFSLIPDQANIGEGCGNPLSIASLAEGETILDLGSGGGFDALLASKKVGSNGKVIGVDMTQKMIDLARRNAEKMGATNTEFINSRIDKIPVGSGTVDCVISNCVLNLVPEEDKQQVMHEIYRVLKPGGRVAISDFLALKPLPQWMKDDPDLKAGCVGGAVEMKLMQGWLLELGFEDILLVDTKKDLSLYKDFESSSADMTPCCAGSTARAGPNISETGRKKIDYDLNEWICKRSMVASSLHGNGC